MLRVPPSWNVFPVSVNCGIAEAKEKPWLAAWSLPRWPGWVEHVNGPPTEAELAALRRCVQRGSPFGEELGATRSSADWDCKARFAPKAAPKSAKTVPDLFFGDKDRGKGCRFTPQQALDIVPKICEAARR